MLYDQRWELDAAGKVLWEAAELLENGKWCQWAFRKNGAMCAAGAIGAVSGRDLGVEDIAFVRLRGVIGEGILSWNDTPGRTKEEVVDALRRAAREVPNR